MNCIINFLRRAKENNLLIEISIQERSGSLVGKIQNFSENYLLLESISHQGLNDGFIVVCLQEIYCIDLETNYSKKVYQLYNLKSQNHDTVPLIDDDYFISLLQYSKSNNLITEIDYFNDAESYGDQGFITDINNCLSMKLIDDFGKISGEKILKIENIKRLYCDGCHARDIKLLYEKDIKG